MATRQMGIYNHQVFDHVALETPVTKLAAHLNPQRAAQQTARALDVATAYPAGPVLLNCPADYSRTDLAQEAVYAPPQTLATCLADNEAETVRAMLRKAKRPLALLGRGVLHEGVPGPIKDFVEAWGLPYFATYKAKGGISDHHTPCIGNVD